MVSWRHLQPGERLLRREGFEWNLGNPTWIILARALGRGKIRRDRRRTLPRRQPLDGAKENGLESDARERRRALADVPHHICENLPFAIGRPPNNRFMFTGALVLRVIVPSEDDIHILSRAALPVVKLVLHMLPDLRHACSDRVVRVPHG